MPAAHRGVVSRRGPQPTGSYPHAHVHGGMVWVESPVSKSPGSSFFLLIPLEEGLCQGSFTFMQQEPAYPAQELFVFGDDGE